MCLASRGNPKATEKDKGISGQRRNNSNKEERKTERKCIEEKKTRSNVLMNSYNVFLKRRSSFNYIINYVSEFISLGLMCCSWWQCDKAAVIWFHTEFRFTKC
jgi:hypothetical protein